jgi:two-component system phosphate regulon sensor histidine kinase PhoR
MKRLWNNSLVLKVFLSYLVIVLLLFASFYFYSSSLLRSSHIASLSSRMEQEAHVLARVLPYGAEGAALDAICRERSKDVGARITVIDAEGKVLGDSSEQSGKMENHGTRPEVLEAFTKGTGSSVRHSDTVGYDMLYRAFLQSDGPSRRIIRVAMPLTEIQESISTLRWTLLAGLIAASALGLLVAYAFSRYLSQRIKRLVGFSQQVADGTFPQNFFPARGRDEINLLEQHLNKMSAKIRDNIEQLTAEKEKVASILRCMLEGVLVLDPKGRVLVINDQAKKMFHVPEDRDYQGLSIIELSRHPEMRMIIQEALAFDFAHPRYSKEIELDEGQWFRVNVVRLRHGTQAILGSILVFHEITEIKRFETMRSDFVANVSHELRTPLTAIRGYVETLLHTPPNDPKDANHFLGIIERHSERLSRLTEDLLTLSDLESGKLQMTRRHLDVGHLIQRVLEVFWDQAAKKQIELSRAVDPDLPQLLGDPDRLQQLFINLVDNALKYTPSGGRVTITAARVLSAQAPQQIEISVSDTGAGIPEKDLPRLTERFYRVDKARSRELGGTGLGLAIVKHIIQAHGGELKIESVVQKGTTVRVFLPSVPAEKPAATLFLCTGNSCRSQMAEGFARQLAPDGHRVFSAGTQPNGVHPLAIQVMKEVGIDIASHRSKKLEAVPLNEISRVITLCGEDAENCPTLPLDVERFHWPLRDPAMARGNEEEILNAFREVRDEIQNRVEQLFARTYPQHPSPSVGEPARNVN